MVSIFSWACWLSVCLLWINALLDLPPIFLLCCSFFDIDLILIVSDISIVCLFLRLICCQLLHCKYFLPFWGLSSHLVYDFLHCTKAFKFHYVPFVFHFISITQGNESEKVLLWFMSKSILPMFSSKSFIVSCLTLRTLIHFKFIFVYSVRECSNFIILHVAVQFSHHYLLKTLHFFIIYSCLLCQRLGDHRCVGLFLCFVSSFTDLYFCFCASVPYCHDDCRFIV